MAMIRALGGWRSLAPAERRFALVACFLTPPVTLALKAAGFRRVRPVLRLPLATPRTGSQIDAERGEELVARVFAHSPVTGTCLPRSMVQVLTHRLLGRPAVLVLGLDPERWEREDDFEAHAWVEEPGGARRYASFERVAEDLR